MNATLQQHYTNKLNMTLNIPSGFSASVFRIRIVNSTQPYTFVHSFNQSKETYILHTG